MKVTTNFRVWSEIKRCLTPTGNRTESEARAMFFRARDLMIEHGIKPQELGRRESEYNSSAQKWGSVS